MAAGNF